MEYKISCIYCPGSDFYNNRFKESSQIEVGERGE